MSLGVRAAHRLGRTFRNLADAFLSWRSLSGVWIDVGAHLGEHTFYFAERNRSLTVYAFEPNLRLAAQRLGLLPNFMVIPMAVAEEDGCADFHINAFDASSSLLPLDPESLEHWIGRELLKVEDKIKVPTIRLDTFMNRMGISCVEYLKIDAQGADFAVVKSAGARLQDISKITLEVAIAPIPVYVGACKKSKVVDFLTANGFVLVSSEQQSHGQEENLTFVRKAL